MKLCDLFTFVTNDPEKGKRIEVMLKLVCPSLSITYTSLPESLMFCWTRKSSILTSKRNSCIFHLSHAHVSKKYFNLREPAVHQQKPWSHIPKPCPILKILIHYSPLSHYASSKMDGVFVLWLENTRCDTRICKRTEKNELLFYSNLSYHIEMCNTSICCLRNYFLRCNTQRINLVLMILFPGTGSCINLLDTETFFANKVCNSRIQNSQVLGRLHTGDRLSSTLDSFSLIIFSFFHCFQPLFTYTYIHTHTVPLPLL